MWDGKDGDSDRGLIGLELVGRMGVGLIGIAIYDLRFTSYDLWIVV
jgi:hypothetical protein